MSIIKKIIKGLRKPVLFGEFFLGKSISRILPDKLFLSWIYRVKIGKRLSLDNPVTYNEKLQWLKLYDHNPKYVELVDKFAVREYVSDTIGEQYLVPLLGVYNTVMEIDFSTLPDQFVMKPTHTSGDVLLCTDKSSLSTSAARDLAATWMRKQYYWGLREWPYKHIRPRIICEELIKTVDGKPPKDYKIFCFNGEPKFAFVATDRGSETKFDFFDSEWNRQSLRQHYPNSDYMLEKPAQWEEMLYLARKLAKDIPHVRVDFYVDARGAIFFGELTFFHFSGLEPFEPESYDYDLGSWIDLTSIKK